MRLCGDGQSWNDSYLRGGHSVGLPNYSLVLHVCCNGNISLDDVTYETAGPGGVSRSRLSDRVGGAEFLIGEHPLCPTKYQSSMPYLTIHLIRYMDHFCDF